MGELRADRSSFGVETNEAFSGEGDVRGFLGFSGSEEAFAEGGEIGIVATHGVGDDAAPTVYGADVIRNQSVQ